MRKFKWSFLFISFIMMLIYASPAAASISASFDELSNDASYVLLYAGQPAGFSGTVTSTTAVSSINVELYEVISETQVNLVKTGSTAVNSDGTWAITFAQLSPAGELVYRDYFVSVSAINTATEPVEKQAPFEIVPVWVFIDNLSFNSAAPTTVAAAPDIITGNFDSDDLPTQVGINVYQAADDWTTGAPMNATPIPASIDATNFTWSANLTGLTMPDGKYKIQATAQTSAGNFVSEGFLVVDSNLPQPVVLSIADAVVQNNPITLSSSESNPTSIYAQPITFQGVANTTGGNNITGVTVEIYRLTTSGPVLEASPAAAFPLVNGQYEWSASTTGTLAPGGYKVVVTATNSINQTATKTAYFSIGSSGPSIANAEVVSDGSSYGIKVIFNKGVYTDVSNNAGTGALAGPDFEVIWADGGDGSISNAAVTGVTNFDGTALMGGETGVLVNLSITGNPDGDDTVTIRPASGTSIYDNMGYALPQDATTGAKPLVAGGGVTVAISGVSSSFSAPTQWTTSTWPASISGTAGTVTGTIASTGVSLQIVELTTSGEQPFGSQIVASTTSETTGYTWTANMSGINLPNGKFKLVATAENSDGIKGTGVAFLDFSTGQSQTTGVWVNANQPPDGPMVVSETPAVTVRLDNFTGDIGKLSLELKNDAGLVLATLTNPTKVLVSTDPVQDDFTFTAASAIFADPGYNNQNINLNLVYTDTVDPTKNKSQVVGGKMIDNQTPGSNFFVQFMGMESSGTYQGLYKFKVELGDQIGSTTLVAGNFIQQRNGAAVTDANKQVVPFYDDMQTQGPYHQVYLYLSGAQDGDNLLIQNLQDTAGHTMAAPVTKNIEFKTQISGTLKDASGTLIPNAHIIMLLDNNGLDFAGSVNGTDVGFYLGTDSNGNIIGPDFKPGNYRIMNIAWSGMNPTNYAYLDQAITIPLMPFGETYQLNLQLNAPNVTGTVAGMTGGMLAFAKTAYLSVDYGDYKEDFYKMAVAKAEVNADGSFSTYLPAGDYKLLGKISPFGSLVPPTTNVLFTVGATTGANLNNANIGFPAQNVFGTIKDAAGNPVQFAGVGIISTDGLVEVIANTNDTGNFGAALPDGNYVIDGVMIFPKFDNVTGTPIVTGKEGMYMLDVAFTVAAGTTASVTGTNLDPAVTAPTLADIMLPAPNVTVKLFEDGLQVDQEARISLFGQSSDFDFDVFGTGQFNLYLKPDTYTMTGVEMLGENYRNISLNQQLIVTGSTNLTGTNYLSVDVTGTSNVVISFVDGQGAATGAGYGVTLQSSTGEYFFRMANSLGKVFFDLAPGTYRIEGYDANQVWNKLNQSFTVTVNDTSAAKLAVSIVVLPANVSGTVKADATTVMAKAWVNLKREPGPGELFPDYVGFQTDDAGHFALNLIPGTYLVEGAGTPSGSWTEMNFKFYVLADGQVSLDGTNPLTGDFVVQRPAPNVSGQLFKTYVSGTGTPFAPFEGWTSGFTGITLHVREMVDQGTYAAAPWLYQKWIDVGVDGSFAANLETGKIYGIYGISTPARWIELDPNNAAYQFNLMTSPTLSNLTIYPAPPNLSGTVRLFDGTAAGKGWLGIEKADRTMWYGTDVDSLGKFGINLPAGEYIIRDFSYEVTVNNVTEYRRMEFNKKITVGSSAVDISLKPNVHGTIGMTLDMTSGEKAGIVIREVLGETDPNYSDWVMNPWRYERWYELQYAGNQATFTGYLEDGTPTSPKTYRLVGVGGPGFWTEIKENIVLKQADLAPVFYNATNQTYSFSLNFTPNVTGTVKTKTGQALANAWVNIEKVVANGQTNDWNNFFGANTNSLGEFGLKLESGNYRVTGYSLPGSWSGVQWLPGEWVSINYPFTVGTTPVVINLQPNVAGQLKKFDTNGAEVAVSNGWVGIKSEDSAGNVDFTNWNDAVWVSTNDQGQFSLMLAPGKYRVINAGGQDYWTELSLSFEIGSNGVLLAGANVIGGELVVKPQQPNVKGTAYDSAGQAVANGWISFKPAAALDDDWNNAKWVSTDASGKFEIFLGDGDWKVADVSSPNSWYPAKLPFNVSGTIITSTKSGAVVSNTLVVRPAQPNVTGVVYDENNNLIDQEAWITIKPAAAGDQDWQNATWAEYKLFGSAREFRVFLEPGDYKIVEVHSPVGFYQANTTFTVGSTGTVTSSALESGKLAIRPPQPNVTGTVFRADDAAQLMANAWVTFIRVDANGNQVTLENTAIPADPTIPAGEIRWEHARGVMGKADATFGLRLEPGTYKIIGAGGDGGWYNPNQTFTVASTGAVTLQVKPPADNVTITVTKSGLADPEAWIDVKSANGWYFPVKLASATSGTYTFTTHLTDGDYEILSFGTPNFWTELHGQLTVTNGSAVVNIDLDGLTTQMVTGTLLNNSASLNQRVWVAIQPVENSSVNTTAVKRWVQTKSDGTFAFELLPGEEWAVTDVTTADGYYTSDNPSTSGTNEADVFAYPVVSSEVPQAGWSIDIISLNLVQ